MHANLVLYEIQRQLPFGSRLIHGALCILKFVVTVNVIDVIFSYGIYDSLSESCQICVACQLSVL